MDSYITISAINDFIYCPKSLYLHGIYSSFETNTYKDTPQVIGTIAHENIENSSYTTSKNILQGTPVSNERLEINGKIDIYNKDTGELIERKYLVKHIYKGYIYQLYAQMYCLEEANYTVKKIFIQSLSDNKRYKIPLPREKDKKEFEALIYKMKHFTLQDILQHNCPRCPNNIYSLLNW